MAAAAAAKSLQSCPTLCDPRDSSPPGSPNPSDSPGKNTGVGCHFLLQCMKVKSESEVAQSCPTQPPHGPQPTRLLHPWDFLGKSTGVGCHCLLHSMAYRFKDRGSQTCVPTGSKWKLSVTLITRHWAAQYHFCHILVVEQSVIGLAKFKRRNKLQLSLGRQAKKLWTFESNPHFCSLTINYLYSFYLQNILPLSPTLS